VGGNVFLDQCIDTVQVSGNTMTGPTTPAYNNTSGLELWGRNITVNNNNSISGYPLEGIGVNSTYNLTVTNNQITGNNLSPLAPNGGVYMWTAGFGPCKPVPRDMQIATLSGNNLTGNAYGVHLGDYPSASRDTIHNLTIVADNTFPASPIYAEYMVAMVDGFSYPPGDLSTNPNPPATNSSTNTGPLRVLPVLNSLQYPLCPATGQAHTTEDTFTFSAADAYGAGDIYDIEGVFSQFGSDADGSGGPGNPNYPPTPPPSGDCHFIYYTASNTVYLDDQNGDYQWTPGSSAVGAGGRDLTNGYCTVHAGSSKSIASTEQKNLNLTLDISFTSGSSHQHFYQFTYDQINDLFSYGQNWYYWGWWLAQ
jgi:hypothetical protein